MVDELDINCNVRLSKYFWSKSMSKNNGINVVSGEKEYEMLFFEALPDDFYDLIEDGGNTQGKVKSNLDRIDGVKILKQHDSNRNVQTSFNGYPIYNNGGEDGLYIVMYSNTNKVEIIDPIKDIMSKCDNIIIKLEGDDDYTVKGFLIKDENDYLISYSNFTSPQLITKYIVFTKLSKFLNIEVRK